MPHVQVQIALVAVLWLLIKHCVADFFLQTPYQYKNKGRYLHPGGLLHSAIHVALTAPLFLLLRPATWEIAALVLAAEYLIHYHVDWTKEQATRRNAWTTQQGAYWNALGVDQLAHGITYVAIVWALMTPGFAAY